MKIVVIGGHLTPALCVLEALPKDAEVLYIGRKYALEGDRAVSLEYKTITEMGIAFAPLSTGRLQRSFSRHTIPSLIKVPIGTLNALRILKKFRPDVVIGFGGYVSVPVVLASRFLKIPVVLHEQTLEAGAANKFLSKYADKICISYESSAKYFPKEKVVLTGNPIRETVAHPKKKFRIEGELPIIYITGGSLGSHAINLLVSQTLSALLNNFIIVHQAGGAVEFKDFEKLSILKDGLNNNKRDRYIVSRYFTPVQSGSIMRQASLVIARAGMNTVTELIYLKKPSLLIPIPVTQRNEQLKNALFLKKLGLGEVEDQRSLDADTFISRINYMMGRIGEYKVTRHKPFPKNAAQKIIEVIYASSKNRN